MSVIGLRVGPFEIEQEATVPEPGDWYRARRAGMTRRQPQEVLVRLLPPDASPEARAALQREYDTLRTLDDARVPSPVAFYEGTGALALSAPEGAPLTALVSERAEGTVNLSPSTLLDLGLEIAEALQHAHTKGKVHGHLSADVIALGSEGRLVVWGFGAGPHTSPSPAWMAPERARSQPVTPSTDQWSLAALLASMVTGKPPWRTADPAAEARKGDPSAIVGAVETQWPAFGRLLRRMMDPHPANRFPSLHPVRQELLALARKAGGTSDRRELASQLLARVPPRRSPEAVEAPPAAPEPAPEAVLAAPSASAARPAPAISTPTSAAPAMSEEAPVSEAAAAVEARPPAPAVRPKRDPLVQEPLPVVRVVWQDEEEPISTEVVLRDDNGPPGPNLMMIGHDLPNLAAAEDPPSGEDLALDPPSEAPEEPLLESSEATMVASHAEVQASIEAMRARSEASRVPSVPAPAPVVAMPTQPDLESSEVTGSDEMTTLFSSASLDMEMHAHAHADDQENPTAVPVTDPGQTTQDPRPGAPVARTRTLPPISHPLPPKRDPYAGDTESGPAYAAPITVEDIEALAAKGISPAAEPVAEVVTSEEPAIMRVAPYIAVAMILGMLVLMAWNWM